MSKLSERGATEERGSALWGTGGRGGDRSSVLWGKGGRGMLLATIVVAFAAPLAATASPGKGVEPTPVAAPAADPAAPSGGPANSPDGKTWVAKGLLDKAKNNPNDTVSVIIQSAGGSTGADNAVKWLAKLAAKNNQSGDFQGNGEKSLQLVGGVALTLPAKWVAKLSNVPGLIVTPDAVTKVSGSISTLASSQLWPYESGNAQVWPGDLTTYLGKAPAIAIVDSGIANRSDFGNRVIASVNLSTIAGNTAADTGTTDQRRSRHVRRGHRGGRGSGPRGCLTWRTARLGQGHERPGHGEDVGRDRSVRVDSRQQGPVQHPCRELLAALELQHELLS